MAAREREKDGGKKGTRRHSSVNQLMMIVLISGRCRSNRSGETGTKSRLKNRLVLTVAAHGRSAFASVHLSRRKESKTSGHFLFLPPPLSHLSIVCMMSNRLSTLASFFKQTNKKGTRPVSSFGSSENDKLLVINGQIRSLHHDGFYFIFISFFFFAEACPANNTHANIGKKKTNIGTEQNGNWCYYGTG